MIRIADPGQLAAIIGDLRLLHRYSQDQLADASGFTQGQISDWSNGKRIPEVKSLIRLAAALGYELALIPREDT